jgi:hypothetical protein
MKKIILNILLATVLLLALFTVAAPSAQANDVFSRFGTNLLATNTVFVCPSATTNSITNAVTIEYNAKNSSGLNISALAFTTNNSAVTPVPLQLLADRDGSKTNFATQPVALIYLYPTGTNFSSFTNIPASILGASKAFKLGYAPNASTNTIWVTNILAQSVYTP